MANLENLKKVLGSSLGKYKSDSAHSRNANRGAMMKSEALGEHAVAKDRAARVKSGNDKYFNKNKERIASGDVSEGDAAEALKRSKRESDANKKVKSAQSKIKTGESLESGRLQKTVGKAATRSMFKR